MCGNLRAQVKHTDVPVPLLIQFCMYCCKHLRSLEYDASGAPLRIAIAIPSLYTETSKTDALQCEEVLNFLNANIEGCKSSSWHAWRCVTNAPESAPHQWQSLNAQCFHGNGKAQSLERAFGKHSAELFGLLGSVGAARNLSDKVSKAFSKSIRKMSGLEDGSRARML